MDDNKTRWVLETGRRSDRELHGFATYAQGLQAAEPHTLGCSVVDLWDESDSWIGVAWCEAGDGSVCTLATLRQATDEDRAELARLEAEGEAA